MKAIILAVALAIAPAAYAEEALKKNNCMACHAVDKKLIGPSFKDIAAKYKSNPKAQEYLTGKIQKGSAGVWGPIPMPANPQVNAADLDKIVKWIVKQ